MGSGTYFFAHATINIDDDYNVKANKFIKILGNPFSIEKEIPLSIALIQICSNIFFILSIIGYFIMRSNDNYWKKSGACYLIGIIVATCVSIIVEQVCVCIKKKHEENIFVNIGVMSMFFIFVVLFMVFILFIL